MKKGENHTKNIQQNNNLNYFKVHFIFETGYFSKLKEIK